MGMNLHGRMKGNYAIYTEMVKGDHQIIQYESMSRLQRSYDVVTLDEVRSTLMNAVCSTTNHNNPGGPPRDSTGALPGGRTPYYLEW